MNMLGLYEAALGQAINRQKTSLFFSKNMSPHQRMVIQGMLGARVMSDCERYLGLPMATGKSKANTFKDHQERISKRVIGRKEKYISKAGQEVLIKTVAQATSTYSMSLSLLPKSLNNTINSTLAKYWWGQIKNERKIHWIHWKKLCYPKNKGGMGFRDIHVFNLTMLAKQARRILHNPTSLFYRVYEARHFSRCSFMKAELGNNPSIVWQSLLATRELL